MLRKVALVFCVWLLAIAQVYSQLNEMNCRNGKTIPCHGTIRVLLIFAEMEYDVHPENDPCPVGKYDQWKAGELPKWKDDFFSPDTNNLKTGRLTQFYAESSFNDYKVLGDYYPQVITIKESEVKSASDGGYHAPKVLEKISAQGEWKSAHGFMPADFDLWTYTTMGMPKKNPSVDSPNKFDHVMFIMRNMVNLKDANGRAAPGSPGKMGIYTCDSYSIFGAYNSMPFNICRHEYTHLFLGDNNFHTGGGGEKFGSGSYQMGIQSMWSVIGAAYSSLMTCNAWDRHRLGWKPKDKNYFISCRDTLGTEVTTDFNDTNTTMGVYVVRDFVNTGDAVRIKLPFIPGKEFQQYLWIENHQTHKFNNSLYDKFQYEDNDCVEDARPGLYMYLQIDKDDMTGSNTYSGYAEYFRPLPARGAYDYIIDTNKVENACINNVAYNTFELNGKNINPLTGTQSLEAAIINLNYNARLEQSEVMHTNIEKRNGEYVKHLLQYGNSTVAFRKDYNSEVSMSTNPSTANCMTATQGIYKINKQNNRTVYMNGIKVTMLEQQTDGAIKIYIEFDNNKIDHNTRLCADSIVLPLVPTKNNTILIAPNIIVNVDRGITPTWPVNCDSINTLHQFLFTQNTKLTLPQHCTLVLQKNSKMIFNNESSFFMMENSKLILEEGATLEFKNESNINTFASSIQLKKGAKIKVYGAKNFNTDIKTKVEAVSKKQISIKK
nr:hypothetical protein [Bacteroidota bacterium]